jgi:hypothetical protein
MRARGIVVFKKDQDTGRWTAVRSFAGNLVQWDMDYVRRMVRNLHRNRKPNPKTYKERKVSIRVINIESEKGQEMKALLAAARQLNSTGEVDNAINY